MDFIENYWFEIIAVFFLWNGAIIIASVIYRKRKQANQAPFDETSLKFYEGWVSGKSTKNLLTRLGGANKCLKVSINAREVYVRPFSPFIFGFLPEILDLEHRIPRDRILKVKTTLDLFGKESVRLTFEDVSDQERSIDLYLKNKNEFVSLLQQ